MDIATLFAGSLAATWLTDSGPDVLKAERELQLDRSSNEG